MTHNLYEFGGVLFQEVVERVHRIDAKAGTLVGYSGVILALLAATVQTWNHSLDIWGTQAFYLAAIATVVAGLLGMMAMGIQDFKWVSASDWLNKKYFDNPDFLKRYWVWVMYDVMQSHRDIGNKKTVYLLIAQWSLFTAILLLAAGLTDALWKH